MRLSSVSSTRDVPEELPGADVLMEELLPMILNMPEKLEVGC
jgi:hypothetical protein